jgi:Tol biopolymer transport system component
MVVGACSDRPAPAAPPLSAAKTATPSASGNAGSTTLIAYTVEVSSSNMDIFTVDRNTGAVAQLTSDAAWDYQPAIWIMKANGTSAHQITHFGTTVGDPVWSPDGTKIALSRSFENINPELYVINADGTNPVRLTNNNAVDKEPTWSPDGSKIAFTSSRNYNYGVTNIWAMPATGGTATQLTFCDVQCGFPAWSPDGAKLAYEKAYQFRGALKVMGLSAGYGSTYTPTTDTLSTYGRPRWSPSGSELVYARYQSDGRTNLYSLHLPTGMKSRLTNSSLEALWPSWAQ